MCRERIIDTGSYRNWRLFLMWCFSKGSLNLKFDILRCGVGRVTFSGRLEIMTVWNEVLFSLSIAL